MSYPDIPKPNDLISNSQNPLRIFFNNVSACIAQNQLAVGSGANQGKNFRTVFITQANDPPMAANESSIFTEKPGAEIELYFKRQGPEGRIQLTGPKPVPINVVSPTESRGFSFLPGDLLIQYGINEAPAASESPDISFETPFGAIPYSVTCTMIRNSNSVASIYIVTGEVTATRFHVRNTDSGGAHSFYWVAIGPQV